MAQETKNKNNEFEKITTGKRPSIVSEFWFFLKHNKKWWLLPILIILLLLGLIVLLEGSALGPFIYPLL
jgi:hypothetical protein